MCDSDVTYDYDVGRKRGTIFRIAARHTPNTNCVESFAVILYFPLSDGTWVEVAKVDDTEHDEGEIHVDRYYRELDADIKSFAVDVDGCWEAEKYLSDHWGHMARTYLDNHGRKPRADGCNVA